MVSFANDYSIKKNSMSQINLIKTLSLSFLFLWTGSFSGFSQKKAAKKMTYTVSKTEKEWQAKLTAAQFKVLRKAGTEYPNSSPLTHEFKTGVYVCAACETPLYVSKNKFESDCGWPSFDQAIDGALELDVDYKIGYARTELKCKNCGSHLGHSFDDGPKKTTGKRHCINGVALKFIPAKK